MKRNLTNLNSQHVARLGRKTIKEKRTMLSELQNFNENRTTLLELVALSVFAVSLRQACEAKNVPSPEWLDDRIRTINRLIDLQTRDAKELRLKEIAAEETRLLTSAEKRERLQAEKAALQASLTTA